VRVGEDALIGRVVGVPTAAPAAVNRVEVLDGHRPEGAGGVLVEEHLAAHFNLGPGDAVEVRTGDGWQRVQVTGVAASTEYLWPARSRQEVFITPDSFGVLFAPQPLVSTLAGGPNEVLVRTRDDGRDATLARIERIAARSGAASIVPRTEQASNAVLQEDIEGFQELAAFFPMLFLTGAAMATAVLLRRRVAGERAIIGTLRANGVTRRQVLGHYLGYGVAAGTLGGVLGAPLGLAGARVLTEAYTSALDLPTTVIEVHPESIAAALAFGVITGVVAAWAPARTAARLAPAEAMRGMVPHAGRAGVADRVLPWLDRLPVTWRLVLRNPWRHPGRTVSTMLGVVLALLLVLVSAGMIDTVRALIDRQFSTVDRTDATAVLDGPADAAWLKTLTDIDGVAAAEPVGQEPVTLVANDHRYSTNLHGFAIDTAMHRFAGGDGRIALPADGALLGAAARDELGVATGDVVTVLDADGGTLGDLTVRGFVDEPLGTPAYVSLATFRDLAGQSAVRTVALRYDDGASATAVTARVEQVPGVLAAVRTAALEDLVAQFLGLFYAFVGAMLVCGGLLAFGILFTTMSANLAERTTEVAMLRASGVRRTRLAGLITAENLLITLVGVLPGIALGWLAAREALAAYTSDLWRFDLTMSPWTVLAAASGIVLAALLSQVPGLRALRRVDIAQTVRRGGT
jgi:putative ABC transport system permease protein